MWDKSLEAGSGAKADLRLWSDAAGTLPGKKGSGLWLRKPGVRRGLWMGRGEGGSRIFSLKRIQFLGEPFLKNLQVPHLEGVEWAAGPKGATQSFCKLQVLGGLRAPLLWE